LVCTNCLSHGLPPVLEEHRIKTVWDVWKFRDPEGIAYKLLRKGLSMKKVLREISAYAGAKHAPALVAYRRIHGNVFLNEGKQFMWNCINAGSCAPPFDASNTHLGVGDGTVAEDPTQTGLQGVNVYYKLVDTGYPQVNVDQFIARATFGPSEAVFTWNEWTVANGNTNDAVNLNRKVTNLGTKSADATWVLQVTLILQ